MFELNEGEVNIPLKSGQNFFYSDSLDLFVVNLGENERTEELYLLCLDAKTGKSKILKKKIQRKDKRKGKASMYFNAQNCKYAFESLASSNVYLLTNGNLWKASLLNEDFISHISVPDQLYDFTFLTDNGYSTLNYYKDLSLRKEMHSSFCTGTFANGHSKCIGFNPGEINYAYFNRARIADFCSKYLTHSVFSEPLVYLKSLSGEVLDSCIIGHEWVSWQEARDSYGEGEFTNKDVLDSYGRVIMEKASKTNAVQFMNDSTILYSSMTTPQRVYETLLSIRNNKLYPTARRGPISNGNADGDQLPSDDFFLLSYYGRFCNNRLVYLAFENGERKGRIKGKFYFYNLVLEE